MGGCFKSVSVVIPVYYGEPSIQELALSLSETLPEVADSYEVIMVDDGSRDGSWALIEKLSQRYEWLHGIKLLRNFGQHAALLCGIRAAQYEVIVTMDDDLQHPPSEIKKLLEKLAEGYDVVYGAALEKQHTTGRNLGSFLIRSILSTILGAETARYASAFRAFRTPLRNAFANYNNPNVVIDVLLSWGAMQLTHVFVEHHARAAGSSRYTLRKLIQHATLMLTGFSTLPLHLASVIGFGLTLVGVLLLIYLIPIRYLILGYEGEVPGFTFLACVITIFAGVQMFAIGIIGEYLAGLHFRMMDRPAYVIDSTTQLHTHNQQVGTSSHE